MAGGAVVDVDQQARGVSGRPRPHEQFMRCLRLKLISHSNIPPPPPPGACAPITGGGGFAEGRREQVEDLAHARRSGDGVEGGEHRQHEGLRCEGEALEHGGAEAQDEQVETTRS